MQVKRLEVFGTRIRSPEAWYWISGTILLLAVVLAQNLMASPTGRALRALHDSEMAARVIGVDAARYKLVVFTISASYAAGAGSCFALFNGYVTPQAADFLHSVELVTMVVVGGMGSIPGSILGAAVLVVLPQALTIFKEYEHLMLGVFIIVMMIFLRDGLVPSLAKLFRPRTP
jgi:branched-chain amino acid transport system permease protein